MKNGTFYENGTFVTFLIKWPTVQNCQNPKSAPGITRACEKWHFWKDFTKKKDPKSSKNDQKWHFSWKPMITESGKHCDHGAFLTHCQGSKMAKNAPSWKEMCTHHFLLKTLKTCNLLDTCFEKSAFFVKNVNFSKKSQK